MVGWGGASFQTIDSDFSRNEVGYLEGPGKLAVVLRLGWFVMSVDGFDDLIRYVMIPKVVGSDLGMVPTYDLFFHGEEILYFVMCLLVDLLEKIGEGDGKDQFAQVMKKAGHVIGFVFEFLVREG